MGNGRGGMEMEREKRGLKRERSAGKIAQNATIWSRGDAHVPYIFRKRGNIHR